MQSNQNYINNIEDVISPLIQNYSSVVLFDFPNHSNVGDSAIWLGEERYFNHINKVKILAVDDYSLVDRDMPRLKDSTVVLLHGGGNLGDLYLRHQRLREKVVSHYLNNRVIQLPQSIHFQNIDNEKRCQKIFASHNDFHLLVRDHVSLDSGERLHRGPTYLCPDMALCLESLPRPKLPNYEILCLLRTDIERVTGALSPSVEGKNIFSSDWLIEPTSLSNRINTCLSNSQVHYPRWTRKLSNIKRPLFKQLAKERLQRGCDLLSMGQVVITDRLHAHILCCLMGIPHIVLDNSYRKIENFIKAWGTGRELCQMAYSLDEAVEKAQKLLVS